MTRIEDERVVYDVPEAGRKLGLGRNAAYEAAARGEIPTIRIGRLLKVPKVAFERMLGKRKQEIEEGSTEKDGNTMSRWWRACVEVLNDPKLKIGESDAWLAPRVAERDANTALSASILPDISKQASANMRSAEDVGP